MSFILYSMILLTVSVQTSDKTVRPVAIAALLQHDTSAIAVPEGSNVKSMSDLDGKTYASYGGRFEMAIIRQMIRNAGGKGDVIEVLPPKLDCYFNQLAKGAVDSTWIFCGWEGISAEIEGVALRSFSLHDEGVPYGYSPCLLSHPSLLSSHAGRALLQSFLAATERGFQFAAANPIEAAECLIEGSGHPSLTSSKGRDLTLRSQQYLSTRGLYLDEEGRWGRMSHSRWAAFVDWLFQNNLITDRAGQVLSRDSVDVSNLFTNDLLPF
jgi:NitT/TauT family transport system substrate-binding protein